MDLLEAMRMAAGLADANDKEGVGTLFRKAITAIEVLQTVGRKVVAARYDTGDCGWDNLKDAICDLEGLVGRPRD